MAETTVRGRIGDKELVFSTGKLALLADGAVVANAGNDRSICEESKFARRKDELFVAYATAYCGLCHARLLRYWRSADNWQWSKFGACRARTVANPDH